MARVCDAPWANAAFSLSLVLDLAVCYRYALAEMLRGSGLSPHADHAMVRSWLAPSDAARAVFEQPSQVTLADLRPHTGGAETALVPLWHSDGSPDLVGSAFYWLAGLDELRTRQRDTHGRVRSADSLLVQSGNATRPLADVYRRWLLSKAHAAQLSLVDDAGWSFCATHDIDALRKWRPGIVWREVGQRAVANRLGESMGRRVRRLASALGGVLTPGDPYALAPMQLADAAARYGARATFLFKADARSIYDVPYPVPHGVLARLRQRGHEIGLHPSHASFDDPSALMREADRVGLSGRYAHRAHYLRYDVLRSPGLLAQAGVSVDSTLGWSDRAGFRRATARPFRLFDLLSGEPTQVVEIPLALMDGALFNRQHLSPVRARAVTQDVLDQAQRSGGAVAGLWHHHTFDADDAPGWADHFERTLRTAAESGANLCTLSQAARTG